MVVQAAPASGLEMGEAELAFQFLVIAFDAPAHFGGVGQNLDGNWTELPMVPTSSALALPFTPRAAMMTGRAKNRQAWNRQTLVDAAPVNCTSRRAISQQFRL